MNPGHQRHLYSTFQYVEQLLSAAERILAEAGKLSPFQQYSQDSTPSQRKVFEDYAFHLRKTMDRILEEQRLPKRPPVSGALWAAQCQLGFAEIAVIEIDPKHMRGYGPLSEEDICALEKIVAELGSELKRLTSCLSEGMKGDLQNRVEQLGETEDRAGLLRELSRIITTQGLVELRPALSLLIERIETDSFEIAIFGRVNSGKSSLLNYLLGQEVLPVGIVPVTAIPTRISFEPVPKLYVEFVDAKPLLTNLSRMAEFVTEEHNPENAKYVSRIRVGLPAPCLESGVTFVDTPGLGSLASGGAEETMAYLPHCDLGVVLVNADSPLNQEDLLIMEALARSGARIMVLLSKADLLAGADRQKMLGYVRDKIMSSLKMDLPVCLVSALGEEARLSDRWFEGELQPLIESWKQNRVLSLDRKIELLKQAVMDALNARIKSGGKDGSSETNTDPAQISKTLRRAALVFESAERAGRALADNFLEVFVSAIQTAAAEIGAGWHAHAPVNSSLLLLESLSRAVEEHSRRFSASQEIARSKLTAILEEVETALELSQGPREEMPRVMELPAVDCTPFAKALGPKRPGWRFLLSRRRLQRFAERRILSQSHDALGEFASMTGKRLEQWHKRSLEQLRGAFEARAGLCLAQLESAVSQPEGQRGSATLREDLAALRH